MTDERNETAAGERADGAPGAERGGVTRRQLLVSGASAALFAAAASFPFARGLGRMQLASGGMPFIGEIIMFGGNFAPTGWAKCDGSLLPIAENDALFTLIGTTYGGDGEQTFALPDLRGRIPLHYGTDPTGTSYALGQMAGVESVVLTVNQIPSHSHPALANSSGNQSGPTNGVWAGGGAVNNFANAEPNGAMAANVLAPAGGSQPHENMAPFLAVTFIISLHGLYPRFS